MSEPSYTPTELAKAEKISRQQLYRLWAMGIGPDYYVAGCGEKFQRRRISEQQRLEWHRRRAVSQQAGA